MKHEVLVHVYLYLPTKGRVVYRWIPCCRPTGQWHRSSLLPNRWRTVSPWRHDVLHCRPWQWPLGRWLLFQRLCQRWWVVVQQLLHIFPQRSFRHRWGLTGFWKRDHLVWGAKRNCMGPQLTSAIADANQTEELHQKSARLIEAVLTLQGKVPDWLKLCQLYAVASSKETLAIGVL